MFGKPLVERELIHSPREEEVVNGPNGISGYLIQIIRNAGKLEVRTTDPGQCLAALTRAKKENVRCLVYAIGKIYDEECLAQVDAKFLMKKHVPETPDGVDSLTAGTGSCPHQGDEA